MIATLVVILILATFLLGVIAVVDDIDRLIEEQERLDAMWEDGEDPAWVADARAEIARLPEVVS